MRILLICLLFDDCNGIIFYLFFEIVPYHIIPCVRFRRVQKISRKTITLMSSEKRCSYNEKCANLPASLLEKCGSPQCENYLHHICQIQEQAIVDPDEKLPMLKKCLDCLMRLVGPSGGVHGDSEITQSVARSLVKPTEE